MGAEELSNAYESKSLGDAESFGLTDVRNYEEASILVMMMASGPGKVVAAVAEKEAEAAAVEKEAESLDKLDKEVLTELLENHPKLTKAKALRLMKAFW